MRFIFIDEGGISQHEPSAIVCGIVVHGDNTLIPLEEALDNIIKEHIPADEQDGFVLHASDIWAGNRTFKDREKWPWDKRAAILNDIVALPEKLNIPIVHGWIKKADVKIPEIARELKQKEKDVMEHVMCFIGCMISADKLMENAFQGEVAQIIAEDNNDARKMIRDSMAYIQNRESLDDESAGLLPIKHIRNPVLFAEKSESKALQLADACAFLIRRRMERDEHRSKSFYYQLMPMMFDVPALDATLVKSWPFGPSIFMRGPSSWRN